MNIVEGKKYLSSLGLKSSVCGMGFALYGCLWISDKEIAEQETLEHLRSLLIRKMRIIESMLATETSTKIKHIESAKENK